MDAYKFSFSFSYKFFREWNSFIPMALFAVKAHSHTFKTPHCWVRTEELIL